MAVLNLTLLWINRLDSGQGVSAKSIDREQAYESDVDVRTYAGGRERAFTAEGEHGVFIFKLRELDLATVALLRLWKGIPVQVRDNRGQRWFGVFGSVKPTEYQEIDLYDAAFTLRVVTVSEGV